jgi:hypothetical protein
LASVDSIGVGFNHTATASKSTTTCIDVMYYGTYVEVTGNTSTTGVNLAFTASTKTITRASGSFTTDGYVSGDYIEVRGSTSNDGVYTVNTVGTTTMTVNETLVDESSASGRTVDYIFGLTEIRQKDETDDSWYGIVTDAIEYQEVNYTLYIGDQSGTARTFFRSTGETFRFGDQPLGTGDLRIETKEDTGVTSFVIGFSTGTGDSRVGFGGSTITQNNAFNGADGTIDLDAAIDTCEIFGSTFLNIGGGVSFAADTTHLVTNVVFDGCGQVAMGSVEARNLTYTGYEDSGDGALLWNSSINVEQAAFLANTAAIEHPAAGDFTYTNLTFAGNDYDIRNSANANADHADRFYSESNRDNDINLDDTTTAVGQSLNGDGNVLGHCFFHLSKNNSPTGNAVAKLYAHTGTYGTNGTPTGVALATSETVNVANLTTTPTLTKFIFSDDEQYTIGSGTKYFIVIEYTSGTSSNYVKVGYDGSSPTHGGNVATYISSWTDDNTKDLCFYCRTGGIANVTATGTSNPSQDKVDDAGTPDGTTFIDISFALSIIGLELNTEVTIVTQGTTTELYHVENASVADGEGKYKITYPHSGGGNVDILIHHVDYLPDISNVYDITLPSADSSIKVKMFDDDFYYNPT